MIPFSSEQNAVLAIDYDTNKNISIHEEKKETEMKKDNPMNDCFYIGFQSNIYPKNKSSIVSSGNITESDKAVSANELIDNTVVYDKSGNVGPSLDQNYNDMYNNASQVDNTNTMVARSSKVKAVSAINCDTNKNISIHEEKKETEIKKR